MPPNPGFIHPFPLASQIDLVYSHSQHARRSAGLAAPHPLRPRRAFHVKHPRHPLPLARITQLSTSCRRGTRISKSAGRYRHVLDLRLKPASRTAGLPARVHDNPLFPPLFSSNGLTHTRATRTTCRTTCDFRVVVVTVRQRKARFLVRPAFLVRPGVRRLQTQLRRQHPLIEHHSGRDSSGPLRRARCRSCTSPASKATRETPDHRHPRRVARSSSPRADPQAREDFTSRFAWNRGPSRFTWNREPTASPKPRRGRRPLHVERTSGRPSQDATATA